jgi:tubulin polyglutamylase TTLL6/13
MLKEFPKDYRFFPKTYLLPQEYGDFKAAFQNKPANNKPVFIIKP